MGVVSRIAAQGSQLADAIRADVAAIRSGLESGLPGLFDRVRDAQLPPDLVHRVTWVIPEEALASGWQCDSDAEQDTTRDLDATLHLERELLQAAGMAREGAPDGSGGAYLWIVLEGAERFADPLPPGPNRIAAVHALGTDEVVPVRWESDPRSPNWSHATHYHLTPKRRGVTYSGSEPVHASRLIRVGGIKRGRNQSTSGQGSDVSAPWLYREAIQGLDQGWRSSARLLERRSVPWVNIRNAGTAARASRGDSDSSGLTAKLRLLKQSLTVDGLLVLLGEDSAGWTSPAVAGTGELVTVLGWRMAAVEGIPIVKLFGTPPAGLSSDDMSALRSYNSILARYQRANLDEALLALYAAALGEDTSRRIVWPDLNKPTDAEASTTSLARAQRDQILLDSGVVTATEVRGRFLDGEEVATYRLETAEAPEVDEMDPLPFGAPPGLTGPVVEDAEEVDDEDLEDEDTVEEDLVEEGATDDDEDATEA